MLVSILLCAWVARLRGGLDTASSWLPRREQLETSLVDWRTRLCRGTQSFGHRPETIYTNYGI